jgi:hypothetical protein
MAWPTASGPFPAQGHALDAHAIVRVNPEARDSYLALVTDSTFPDGTVAAALHEPEDLNQGRGQDLNQGRFT